MTAYLAILLVLMQAPASCEERGVMLELLVQEQGNQIADSDKLVSELEQELIATRNEAASLLRALEAQKQVTESYKALWQTEVDANKALRKHTLWEKVDLSLKSALIGSLVTLYAVED